MILSKKKHYLQVALNSSPKEARQIIADIPLDERIIIEAGTPLLKEYGAGIISMIRSAWAQRLGTSFQRGYSIPFSVALDASLRGGVNLSTKHYAESKRAFKQKQKTMPLEPYIVADFKCMDRGAREVDIAFEKGASAVTALGHAPLETLDAFVEKCEGYGIDAMIDMMNVDFPLGILRKMKKLPQVVILHRGVDEERFNREKELPLYEIQRIKSEYDILVAVAGGDTFGEVQRAVFNDVDIVVVWKSFYKSSAETSEIARKFLKEIR